MAKTILSPDSSGIFRVPETPISNVKSNGKTLLTPSSTSPKTRNTKARKLRKTRRKKFSFRDSDDSDLDDNNDENDNYSNTTFDIDFPELYRQRLGFEVKGLGQPEKPPYSYASLIGMSIITSDYKRLRLSEIYDWISSNFSYYKKGDVGWQNSIRHNLSLNKAFTKSEKSENGKGHYWQIEEGMEDIFLTDRSSNRKSSKKIAKKPTAVPVTTKLKSLPKIYEDLTPSSTFLQEDENPLLEASDQDTDSLSDSDPPSQKDIFTEELQSLVQRPLLAKQRFSIDTSSSIIKQPRKRSVPLKRGPNHFFDTESDNESEDDFDLKENIEPQKKSKISLSASKSVFDKIPQLQAPSSSWSASARGENVTFISNGESNASKSPDLRFTSSFNSNLNFDLSPIRRTETGPILEPVTPKLSNIMPTMTAQNSKTSSSRTPNRITKTPSSASIVRKIWSSPSYLDDFYTSPSHEHKKRNRRNSRLSNSTAALLSASYNGSPKKQNKSSKDQKSPRKLESSIIGNISTSYNDFFGVDICSVVKRAVESAVEEPKKKAT